MHKKYQENTDRKIVIISVVLSVFVSAVAANRYVFTPLGLDSIGRQWQNYVNYYDFGFQRRAFIGTVNSFFIPDGFLDRKIDHRVASWIIHNIYFLIFAVFFILTTVICLRQSSGYTKAAILLSPFFLMHYAYSSDNQDAVLSLIALSCVLFIDRFIIISLLCTLGILVHESFLFAYVPIICALMYVHGKSFSKPTVLATSAVAVFIAVILYSQLYFNTEYYVEQFSVVVPRLERTGVWELSSGVWANLKFTSASLREASKDVFTISIWIFIVALLGILYLFLIPIDRSADAVPFAAGVILPVTILLPIATDIYRWFAYSGFCIFLIHLYLSQRGKVSSTLAERRPKLLFVLSVPLFLLGPLGSSCFEDCGKASFPIFFSAVDKLLGGH